MRQRPRSHISVMEAGMQANSAALVQRRARYHAWEGPMAAPPVQHPTWIETILGGGLLTVLIPRIMDAIRGTLLRRRKGDASVTIAEIEDERQYRRDLEARIRDLEA